MSIFRTKASNYPLIFASEAVSRGYCGGLEDKMSYRANPLVPAVFASLLGAAIVLSTIGATLAAGACIEKPNRQFDRAGHWYYHVDRVNHRRCWFLETSEVTMSPHSSPDPVLSSNVPSQPSWFSRLIAGWTQTFSAEPQQNTMLADASTVTRPTSPKRPKTHKIVRTEQPHIAPLSKTNGAASIERRNQFPLQSIAERNEIQTPQLTAAGREALFEEFLKWYVDRSIFGHP
jgi:hypothetical protein